MEFGRWNCRNPSCFFCIYLPDGFVVFMVWACVDVLKVFFFLSLNQSMCARRDWEINRKKKRLFPECEGWEWIEANANPLLVCHYIVTFLPSPS